MYAAFAALPEVNLRYTKSQDAGIVWLIAISDREPLLSFIVFQEELLYEYSAIANLTHPVTTIEERSVIFILYVPTTIQV